MNKLLEINWGRIRMLLAFGLVFSLMTTSLAGMFTFFLALADEKFTLTSSLAFLAWTFPIFFATGFLGAWSRWETQTELKRELGFICRIALFFNPVGLWLVPLIALFRKIHLRSLGVPKCFS